MTTTTITIPTINITDLTAAEWIALTAYEDRCIDAARATLQGGGPFPARVQAFIAAELAARQDAVEALEVGA